MLFKSLSVLLISSTLLFNQSVEASEKASFKQCSKIVKKIKAYEQKRRDGGKIKQMNKWKKKRAEYQLKFYKKRCNEYRNLKID